MIIRQTELTVFGQKNSPPLYHQPEDGLFTPLHALALLLRQFPDVFLFLAPSLMPNLPVIGLTFSTAVPASLAGSADLVFSLPTLDLTAVSRRALPSGNFVRGIADPFLNVFFLPQLP